MINSIFFSLKTMHCLIKTTTMLTGNPLLCPVPDYSSFSNITDYNPDYCSDAIAMKISWAMMGILLLLGFFFSL
jgi:hypothetical protein